MYCTAVCSVLGEPFDNLVLESQELNHTLCERVGSVWIFACSQPLPKMQGLKDTADDRKAPV